MHPLFQTFLFENRALGAGTDYVIVCFFEDALRDALRGLQPRSFIMLPVATIRTEYSCRQRQHNAASELQVPKSEYEYNLGARCSRGWHLR
jgi:hypothetical protein